MCLSEVKASLILKTRVTSRFTKVLRCSSKQSATYTL